MRGGSLSIHTAEDTAPVGLFELQVAGEAPTTEDQLQAIQAQLDAAVQSGQATELLKQYLIDTGRWDEMTSQWKVTSLAVGLASPTYAPSSAAGSSSPSNGSSPQVDCDDCCSCKQCDTMHDLGCSTSLFAPAADSPMSSCSVVPVNYCYNATTLGLRAAGPDTGKPTPKPKLQASLQPFQL